VAETREREQLTYPQVLDLLAEYEGQWAHVLLRGPVVFDPSDPDLERFAVGHFPLLRMDVVLGKLGYTRGAVAEVEARHPDRAPLVRIELLFGDRDPPDEMGELHLSPESFLGADRERGDEDTDWVLCVRTETGEIVWFLHDERVVTHGPGSAGP
jgi:hypothetical protein